MGCGPGARLTGPASPVCDISTTLGGGSGGTASPSLQWRRLITQGQLSSGLGPSQPAKGLVSENALGVLGREGLGVHWCCGLGGRISGCLHHRGCPKSDWLVTQPQNQLLLLTRHPGWPHNTVPGETHTTTEAYCP